MRRHMRPGLLAALVIATGVLTVCASGQVHANSVNPARTRIDLQQTMNAVGTIKQDGDPCVQAFWKVADEFDAWTKNQQLSQDQNWVSKTVDDATATANTCSDNLKTVSGLSFDASLPYFHMVHLSQSMEKAMLQGMIWTGEHTVSWLKNDGQAGPGNVDYDIVLAGEPLLLQSEFQKGFPQDLQAAHPSTIVPHIRALSLRKALLRLHLRPRTRCL